MNCLFCKIVNKEIPADMFYENENAVAILDIHPRAPGHSVIIPKFHAQNILELPDDKIEAVFGAVKKTTQILKDKFSPDGFTIGINHGKVSGQAVDHLHIHIIPRYYADGGGSMHSVVNNPPESLDEIKKKIK
ncbi:MAG: HIT family protein [Patescibacteria group bacterium]|nr:HIT family protein [Patescibacteria group bacterium]